MVKPPLGSDSVEARVLQSRVLHSRALRMMAPVLIPLMALALQALFWTQLQPYVWFLFYPAVFAVALLSNRSSGVIATVLSVVLVWQFFILPDPALAGRKSAEVFSSLVFLATGLGFSLFSQRARKIQKLQALNQTLRADEARYHSLFDNSMDGVMLAAPDGSILAANRAAQLMFRRTEADLRRVGREGVVVTDDPVCVAAMAQQSQSGSFRAEFQGKRSDGTLFPMEVSSVLFEGEDGQTLCSLILRDLTRQKDAESQLRSSEARLSLFIEHAPAALAMFDTQMRYLAVSQRWLHDYGLNGQDVLGRLHYEVFPDISAAWKASHQRGMQGEVIVSEEDRLERKDGSTQWLRWEVRPWRQRDDSVGGIVILSEDISKRKRDEEQIRRLSQAVEQSPVSVLITDLNKRIEYVNAAFTLNTGYEAHEVLGRMPSMLQSGKTPRETYASLWTALRAGRTWKGEFTNRHKSGREMTELAIISPIRQPDGSITHYLAVQEDITERKRLAAELEQHHAHLEELVAARTADLQTAHNQLQITQAAMDSVGIGTRWLDVATSRFVHANTYGAGMLGYSVEEFVQMSVQDVAPDLDGARLAQIVDTVKRDGRHRFELMNKARDGSLIPVEATLYHLPGRPNGLGSGDGLLIAFVVDIRQRKAAEQALIIAKEAAEAANRAKSSFLANMSHEIRTPMNAIIGITHLLRRDQPSPEQAERLDRVLSASAHLLAIINDILDLSKIEAGRLTLEQTDFTLQSVFNHVHYLIADAARSKGLRIELDMGDVPELLRGDPTRLRQALINYASNAIKFTSHGSVAVRARLLARDEQGLLLRFEVQDTGIGIAAHELSSLFQAFRQADASITRHYGGTGLGLAITQRLAQLMDGEVGVSSQPGVGSTFWFTARLAPGQSRPGNTSPLTPHQLETMLGRYSRAHLLLAEDDPINQDVAIWMLRSVGMSADLANNGSEALTLAAGRHYDLILMDVQMPGMDGIAACKAIRALPGHAATPILAMTANAFKDDRKTCLAAGMNDFIAKPIDPDVLFATLLKWLPAQLSQVHEHAVQALPPAPDGQGAATALAGVPDLSVATGLKAAGTVERLEQLLRQFVAGHGAEIKALPTMLTPAHLDLAHRMAHTLKGTAGTLGLTLLQGRAAALETALQAERSALPASADMHAAATRAAAALIEAFEPLQEAMARLAPTPADQGAALPFDLSALLSELETLLADDDPHAERRFQDQLPRLRQRIDAAVLAQLTRAFENFDLPDALDIVRRLQH